MKEGSRANNQAHIIIQAAADVVAHQGAHKLTIENVAKQAGLSKGGVLYHFPNKEALLSGMLEHLTETLDARREEKAQDSELEKMLNTIDLDNETDRALTLAILAVSAQQPELLAPAREYFRERVATINQQLDDQEMAAILLMALEGLRLLTMLDMNPWSKAQTRKTLKKMHELARETV